MFPSRVVLFGPSLPPLSYAFSFSIRNARAAPSRERRRTFEISHFTQSIWLKSLHHSHVEICGLVFVLRPFLIIPELKRSRRRIGTLEAQPETDVRRLFKHAISNSKSNFIGAMISCHRIDCVCSGTCTQKTCI